MDGTLFIIKFGGPEQKYNVNFNILLRYLNSTKSLNGLAALDLGCGSGFQTIPLLKLGYNVTALDLSPHLLQEVENEFSKLGLSSEKLETIQGDLLGFLNLCQSNQNRDAGISDSYLSKNAMNSASLDYNVIVCMGDTLTHLDCVSEVKQLISDAYSALSNGGILILQFKDLTKPLVGTDRFIPVRSDERTVFTCFLEWEENSQVEADGSGCIIRVHDLVHVKKGIGAWELCKSWYKKLGLTGPYVIKALESAGFVVEDAVNDFGMVTLVSHKK